MTHEELKKQFTIIINEHKFVPHINEDEQYYHLVYIDDTISNIDFAVTKGSYMPIIKRSITDELYTELKNEGVLY